MYLIVSYVPVCLWRAATRLFVVELNAGDGVHNR